MGRVTQPVRSGKHTLAEQPAATHGTERRSHLAGRPAYALASRIELQLLLLAGLLMAVARYL